MDCLQMSVRPVNDMFVNHLQEGSHVNKLRGVLLAQVLKNGQSLCATGVVVPGQVVPLSIPGGEDAASWFKAALQRDSEWASFVVLVLLPLVAEFATADFAGITCKETVDATPSCQPFQLLFASYLVLNS